MASIKQINRALLASLALAVLCVGPASALEAEQRDAVIQNCSNIKQSLAALQRADSRTRTYLGSAYEAIAGRFITPLNLRLVKNGLPSTELFRIQGAFTAAHTDFRNSYVDYMRELDVLMTTDCAAHPDDFYQKLETTRAKRAQLRTATQTLATLVDEQYRAVTALRAGL